MSYSHRTFITLAGCNQPAKRFFTRILSLLITLTFVFPYLTWAFEVATFQTGVKSLLFNNQLIEIPKKLGTIVETFQGNQNLVVHIQDLHCNYEVQTNIANILDKLADKYNLNLVGVEGASLPVNVTKLSTFPNETVKKLVGNYFMQQGKMSGSEYYAAVGDHPLRLEGIETPAHYRTARRIVSQFLTDESSGQVLDLLEAFEEIKPAIYNPLLLKWDKRRTAYRHGRVTLLTFALDVYGRAKALGLDLQHFPNLKRYVSKRMNLFPLEVESDQLFNDLDRLERLVRNTLYVSEREKDLDELLRRLEIVEKLINVSATPSELAEFRAYPGRFRVGVFLRFLADFPVREELDTDLHALNQSLEQVAAFYENADLRSRDFVRNLTGVMQARRVRLAALATGGFHTNLVLRELRRTGVSYLSIKPRLSRLDHVNPYFSLLKNRATPLEKLLAQNQEKIALVSMFRQWLDPEAILNEKQLPPEIRITYQILDLTLKLLLVNQLISSGLRELEPLQAALGSEIATYRANNPDINLEVESLVAQGDAFMVTVPSLSLVAAVCPAHAQRHMPRTSVRSFTVNGQTFSYYHHTDQAQVAAGIARAGEAVDLVARGRAVLTRLGEWHQAGLRGMTHFLRTNLTPAQLRLALTSQTLLVAVAGVAALYLALTQSPDSAVFMSAAVLGGIREKREPNIQFFRQGLDEENDPGLLAKLGGKGRNLHEMARLGLPVPPGFVIQSEMSKRVIKSGRLFNYLKREMLGNLRRLIRATGQNFGDPDNPLFLSVRSGAERSMPGMMLTITHVGLNEQTVRGLARQVGDEDYAWHAYARFVEDFGFKVMGVPAERFQSLREAQLQTMQTSFFHAADSQTLISAYQVLIQNETGQAFPQEVEDQLFMATQRVMTSWDDQRVRNFRAEHNIPDTGTGVTVQKMVLGDVNQLSGSGVIYSRDPFTGEKILSGDLGRGRVGEEVVSGRIRSEDIEQLREWQPEVYAELKKYAALLEKHFKSTQDIEFTIENGKLYLLQTRSADTMLFPMAKARIILDMLKEKLITPQDVQARVNLDELHWIEEYLRSPRLPQSLEHLSVTRGQPAAVGVAAGKVALTEADAQRFIAQDEEYILVLERSDINQEEIIAHPLCVGVVEHKGGKFSHASALMRQARNLRPCVIGVQEMDLHAHVPQPFVRFNLAEKTSPGHIITVDGNTGLIYLGDQTARQVKSTVRRVQEDHDDRLRDTQEWRFFKQIQAWIDQHQNRMQEEQQNLKDLIQAWKRNPELALTPELREILERIQDVAPEMFAADKFRLLYAIVVLITSKNRFKNIDFSNQRIIEYMLDKKIFNEYMDFELSDFLTKTFRPPGDYKNTPPDNALEYSESAQVMALIHRINPELARNIFNNCFGLHEHLSELYAAMAQTNPEELIRLMETLSINPSLFTKEVDMTKKELPSKYSELGVYTMLTFFALTRGLNKIPGKKLVEILISVSGKTLTNLVSEFLMVDENPQVKVREEEYYLKFRKREALNKLLRQAVSHTPFADDFWRAVNITDKARGKGWMTKRLEEIGVTLPSDKPTVAEPRATWPEGLLPRFRERVIDENGQLKRGALARAIFLENLWLLPVLVVAGGLTSALAFFAPEQGSALVQLALQSLVGLVYALTFTRAHGPTVVVYDQKLGRYVETARTPGHTSQLLVLSLGLSALTLGGLALGALGLFGLSLGWSMAFGVFVGLAAAYLWHFAWDIFFTRRMPGLATGLFQPETPASKHRTVVEVTMESRLSEEILDRVRTNLLDPLHPLRSKLDTVLQSVGNDVDLALEVLAMSGSSGEIGPLITDRIEDLSRQSGLKKVVGVRPLYNEVWMQQVKPGRKGQADQFLLRKVPIGDALRSSLTRTKVMDSDQDLFLNVPMYDGRLLRVAVWEDVDPETGSVMYYLDDYITGAQEPNVFDVVYSGYADKHDSARFRDDLAAKKRIAMEQSYLIGRGYLALLEALQIKPDTVILSEIGAGAFAMPQMVEDAYKNSPQTRGTQFIFNDHTSLEYTHLIEHQDFLAKYPLAQELVHLNIDQENRVHITSLIASLAQSVYGVSRLHCQTMQSMPAYQHVREKLRYITNGVNLKFWQRGRFPQWRDLNDDELVTEKEQARGRMLQLLARRLGQDEAWISGMAGKTIINWTRQVAHYTQLYKLAEALRDDALRAEFVRNDIVLVIGGRVHQDDHESQVLIQDFLNLVHLHPELRDRLIYYPNFNTMDMQTIAAGVDGTIMAANERHGASATGFMKVLVNGGIVIGSPDGAVPENCVFLGKAEDYANQLPAEGVRFTEKPRGANAVILPYDVMDYEDGGRRSSSPAALISALVLAHQTLANPESRIGMMRRALLESDKISTKRVAKEMVGLLNSLEAKTQKREAALEEGRKTALRDLSGLSYLNLERLLSKKSRGFPWKTEEIKVLLVGSEDPARQGTLAGLVDEFEAIQQLGDLMEPVLLFNARGNPDFNSKEGQAGGYLVSHIRQALKHNFQQVPLVYQEYLLDYLDKLGQQVQTARASDDRETMLEAQLKAMGLLTGLRQDLRRIQMFKQLQESLLHYYLNPLVSLGGFARRVMPLHQDYFISRRAGEDLTQGEHLLQTIDRIETWVMTGLEDVIERQARMYARNPAQLEMCVQRVLTEVLLNIELPSNELQAMLNQIPKKTLDKKALQYLSIMQRELDRIVQTNQEIRGVLDFELEGPRPINAAWAVQRALQRLGDRAANVVVDNQVKNAPLLVNPAQLADILENLLQSALNNNAMHITVRLTQENHNLKIAIQDDGLAFTDTALDRVVAVPYFAVREVRRKAGAEYFLAGRLAKAENGRLTLSQEEQVEAATFTVTLTLPLYTVEGALAEVPDQPHWDALVRLITEQAGAQTVDQIQQSLMQALRDIFGFDRANFYKLIPTDQGTWRYEITGRYGLPGFSSAFVTREFDPWDEKYHLLQNYEEQRTPDSRVQVINTRHQDPRVNPRHFLKDLFNYKLFRFGTSWLYLYFVRLNVDFLIFLAGIGPIRWLVRRLPQTWLQDINRSITVALAPKGKAPLGMLFILPKRKINPEEQKLLTWITRSAGLAYDRVNRINQLTKQWQPYRSRPTPVELDELTRQGQTLFNALSVQFNDLAAKIAAAGEWGAGLHEELTDWIRSLDQVANPFLWRTMVREPVRVPDMPLDTSNQEAFLEDYELRVNQAGSFNEVQGLHNQALDLLPSLRLTTRMQQQILSATLAQLAESALANISCLELLAITQPLDGLLEKLAELREAPLPNEYAQPLARSHKALDTFHQRIRQLRGMDPAEFAVFDYAKRLLAAHTSGEIFEGLFNTVLNHTPFSGLDVYDTRLDENRTLWYRSLKRSGMWGQSSARQWTQLRSNVEKHRLAAVTVHGWDEARDPAGKLIYEQVREEGPQDYLYIEQRHLAPFVDKRELLRDAVRHSMQSWPRWLLNFSEAAILAMPQGLAAAAIRILLAIRPRWVRRVNSILHLPLYDRGRNLRGMLLLNNWQNNQPLFENEEQKDDVLANLALLNSLLEVNLSWVTQEESLQNNLDELHLVVQELNEPFRQTFLENISNLEARLLRDNYLKNLMVLVREAGVFSEDQEPEVRKLLQTIKGCADRLNIQIENLANVQDRLRTRQAVITEETETRVQALEARQDLGQDAPFIGDEQEILSRLNQQLAAARNAEDIDLLVIGILREAANNFLLRNLIMVQARLAYQRVLRVCLSEREQQTLQDSLRALSREFATLFSSSQESLLFLTSIARLSDEQLGPHGRENLQEVQEVIKRLFMYFPRIQLFTANLERVLSSREAMLAERQAHPERAPDQDNQYIMLFEALTSSDPAAELTNILRYGVLTAGLPGFKHLQDFQGSQEIRKPFVQGVLQTLGQLRSVTPGSMRQLRRTAPGQRTLRLRDVLKLRGLYQRTRKAGHEYLLWLLALLVIEGRQFHRLPDPQRQLVASLARSIVVRFNQETGQTLNADLAAKVFRYYTTLKAYLFGELAWDTVQQTLADFREDELELLVLVTFITLKNTGPGSALTRGAAADLLEQFGSWTKYEQWMRREVSGRDSAWSRLRIWAFLPESGLTVPESETRLARIKERINAKITSTEQSDFYHWLGQVTIRGAAANFAYLSEDNLVKFLYVHWRLSQHLEEIPELLLEREGETGNLEVALRLLEDDYAVLTENFHTAAHHIQSEHYATVGNLNYRILEIPEGTKQLSLKVTGITPGQRAAFQTDDKTQPPRRRFTLRSIIFFTLGLGLVALAFSYLPEIRAWLPGKLFVLDQGRAELSQVATVPALGLLLTDHPQIQRFGQLFTRPFRTSARAKAKVEKWVQELHASARYVYPTTTAVWLQQLLRWFFAQRAPLWTWKAHFAGQETLWGRIEATRLKMFDEIRLQLRRLTAIQRAFYPASGPDISTLLLTGDPDKIIMADQLPFGTPDNVAASESLREAYWKDKQREYWKDKQSEETRMRGWSFFKVLKNIGNLISPLVWELEMLGATDVVITRVSPTEHRITFAWGRHLADIRPREITFFSEVDLENLDAYPDALNEFLAQGFDFYMQKAAVGFHQHKAVEHHLQYLKNNGLVMTDLLIPKIMQDESYLPLKLEYFIKDMHRFALGYGHETNVHQKNPSHPEYLRPPGSGLGLARLEVLGALTLVAGLGLAILGATGLAAGGVGVLLGTGLIALGLASLVLPLIRTTLSRVSQPADPVAGEPVVEAATPPRARVEVVAELRHRETILPQRPNAPYHQSEPRAARGVQRILNSLLYMRDWQHAGNLRLRLPLDGLHHLFQAAIGLWKGLIAWIWLSGPAMDAEAFVEENPDLLELMRKHALPDQQAATAFTRRYGVAVDAIRVRPLSELDLNLTGRLGALWRLGGTYRETGENRQPTLYLPDSMLQRLLPGVPAQRGLLGTWQRWLWFGNRFLLGMLMRYQTGRYFADQRLGRGAQRAEDREADLEFLDRAAYLTRLKGEDTAQTFYSRHQGAQLALSAYDILKLSAQYLSESAQLLGESRPTALAELQPRLADALQRSAEPSVETTLALLADAETAPDSELSLFQSILAESQDLAVDRRQLVLKDLVAELVDSQTRAYNVQLGRQAETARLTSGEQIYILSLPQSFTRILSQINALDQRLRARADQDPRVAPLRERLAYLKEALSAALPAQAGTLQPLNPRVASVLLGETLRLSREEGTVLMDLGEDVDSHLVGVTTGDITKQDWDGVQIASREIFEVTGPDLARIVDNLFQSDLQSAGLLARAYQGTLEQAVPIPQVRFPGLARMLVSVSRVLPAPLSVSLQQAAQRLDPSGYLTGVLANVTDSPFVQLHQDLTSPIGQAYLRWSSQMNRSNEIRYIRTMVRFLKAQRLEIQEATGILPSSEVSALKAAHQASLIGFLEMTRNMASLSGIRIGKWSERLSGVTRDAVEIPGILVQPGNMGTWGALRDVMRGFEAIDIEPDVFEYRRRRLFRTASQAA